MLLKLCYSPCTVRAGDPNLKPVGYFWYNIMNQESPYFHEVVSLLHVLELFVLSKLSA